MPATSRVSAPLDSVQHQNEDEALSSIISGIYDAALDPGRWCEVLAAIAGFVGGQAGGLLSKEPAQGWARRRSLCRRRSPISRELPGTLFELLPALTRAVRRASAGRQHSGARALQRVPAGAILPGVGATAGLARRRQYHRRKVGTVLLHLQRGARRGQRHGRLRNAPAHDASRRRTSGGPRSCGTRWMASGPKSQPLRRPSTG